MNGVAFASTSSRKSSSSIVITSSITADRYQSNSTTSARTESALPTTRAISSIVRSPLMRAMMTRSSSESGAGSSMSAGTASPGIEVASR
jgi:hypothetical protein